MTPQSEAELAEIISAARRPVHIRGGGTRPVGRPVTGEVLETSGLSGVTLYEPGALTIVVRAGTPVAEVDAVLAAENQRLAFEPMDHRGLLGSVGEPTIGGVVAANVSGPRRIQSGACRDFMLGVRLVDGAGRVLKNGGRVMKNVTGYDLVKLMTGSWGTLGVLSEVSLKVLPRTETQSTISIDGLDDVAAVQAMSRALGSPYEVTGAAHLPGKAPVTRLRIEGFAASVAYRAEAISALFSDRSVHIEADAEASDALWRDVREVAAMQRVPGDVWRLSCKPSDAPGLVAKAAPAQALYDWGGGLVWMRVPECTDVRAALGTFAGHATLVRGSLDSRKALPVFQPELPTVAALSEGLRARFDPRGLLNPGLMSA